MKSYRTFVFALVSVIGGIATMFGATIPPEVLDELAKNLEIVIGGLITAYGAAIFIFRAISSTPMFQNGNPFAAAWRTVVGWFSGSSAPKVLFAAALIAALAGGLAGCAPPTKIIDDSAATSPTEKAQLQAMEAVAQAEVALAQAWVALQSQANGGVLFKGEVQAIEAELDKAGAILDEAHDAINNGLWDLATGKAGETGDLADSAHALLGKYLKERRKNEGGER